ncbi:MAG: hypothetical protein E6Q50_18200 [Lysobacter sp.]|nr:MAG: hypothetical protein E6Q50_18200 [Lysobacter sp.]
MKGNLKLKNGGIAVLLLVTAFNCSFAKSAEHFLANVDYSLTKDELEQLSREALDGSPEAATRVMNHYVALRKDRKKSLAWAVIGAENGSAESQYMAYQLFADSKAIDDQRRALFWLGKSAANGYFGADSVYKVCNSITSRHGDPDKTPCFGPKSDNFWPR